MFSLVEPINLTDMVDRPHLGCAMLIAACRQKGMETTLIQAQTRYIQDMFVADSEEIWNLYQDLENNETSRTWVRYGELFRNWPLDRFRQEMGALYHEVIARKTIRSCFHAAAVRRFLTLYNDFCGLYRYYIVHSGYTQLCLADRYVREIVQSGPRYLGWSLRGGFDPLSRSIRKRVKEETGVPIILGGAFTPFIDLKAAESLFEDECFDYLVVGAGEKALPSLLESLQDERVPAGIPNVVYLEKKRLRAGKMEVIADLNQLPSPDFSQFDLDRYLTPVRILPIQTARGCYWRKCAFCSHHRIDQGNYKEWPIEKVVNILFQLKKEYVCSHFFLEDESVSPKRARKLSEAILEQELQVRLDMRGRFEEGFDDDSLLGLMRSAGFSAVSWGLESACQKVLNAMGKGTQKATIQRVLRKASRNRIANLCFIMCGFPSETREDFQETIDFLMENDAYIDRVMSSVFAFERDAPVGQNPEKWGIVAHPDGTISTRTGMTREDVVPVYEKALDRYQQFLEGRRRFAKYPVSGYDSGQIVRMIIFFLFSRLLPEMEVMESLRSGNGAGMNPIVLGTMKAGEKPPRLLPVNARRSVLNNFLDPEEERPMNEAEAALFDMADGTLSVARMIRVLEEKGFCFSKDGSAEDKVRSFFHEVFAKDWGVALEQEI